MSDILSILTVVITGVATLSNVILVAKRYKELKEVTSVDAMKKKINIANDMLRDANAMLHEAKLKNDGKSPLDSGEREQFIKLIEELDDQVKQSNKQIM